MEITKPRRARPMGCTKKLFDEKQDPGTRGKAVVREDTPGSHVPCEVSRKITFVGLLRDGGWQRACTL